MTDLWGLDVEAHQVFVRLAPHHFTCRTICHKDNSWSWDLVVIARHGLTLCTSYGRYQKIARLNIRGNKRIVNHDVATLAMLTHNAHMFGAIS